MPKKVIIKLEGVQCQRCGHKWVPRGPEPVRCARCKTPYWRTKRRA